jgi:hypothetical protein
MPEKIVTKMTALGLNLTASAEVRPKMLLDGMAHQEVRQASVKLSHGQQYIVYMANYLGTSER